MAVIIRNVANVMEALVKFEEKIIKDVVLEVGIQLEAATPKLTTFASKNWVPQIGSRFEGLSGVRSYFTPINTASRDAGVNSIESYKLNKGPVYISNNVPYITFLNAGTSAKAPANFVQKAIAVGILTALNRY